MAEVIGAIFGSLFRMLTMYFIVLFILKLFKLKNKELYLTSLISTVILDLIIVFTVAHNIRYFVYDLTFIPIWLIFYLKNKVE